MQIDWRLSQNWLFSNYCAWEIWHWIQVSAKYSNFPASFCGTMILLLRTIHFCVDNCFNILVVYKVWRAHKLTCSRDVNIGRAGARGKWAKLCHRWSANFPPRDAEQIWRSFRRDFTFTGHEMLCVQRKLILLLYWVCKHLRSSTPTYF